MINFTIGGQKHSAEDFASMFQKASPKSCDLAVIDYVVNRREVDAEADLAGYRYVGNREGRSVFSSKGA